MAVRRCGVSNVKLQGWWPHLESILSPWAHMTCAPWACWVNLRGGVWVHDPLTEFVMVEQLVMSWFEAKDENPSKAIFSYLALAWSCQFAVWCCAATLNTDFGGPSKYQLSNIGSPCKEYVVRIVCALHVVVECSWLWSSNRHQKTGSLKKAIPGRFFACRIIQGHLSLILSSKAYFYASPTSGNLPTTEFPGKNHRTPKSPNPQNPENLLTAACLWLHQAQTPKRPIYFNDLTLRCGDTVGFGDGLGKVDHDPRRTLPSSMTFV